ncbi:MAG: hypothetical protein DI533_22335 [Cereibacter sphaeroides]|uniref:Uncharacterized protein n=1 Tax=Cereibacter sphaeroides TaxID=1063 RepID=A0A2W5S2X1_CERSP|nr:MAG: hypothetical protein DI533_22335 [Cereibacter sphaeroides]
MINFIPQQALNEAVLFQLFVHAQKADERLLKDEIARLFSIAVSAKRVELALDDLVERSFVSRWVNSGSSSIKPEGYKYVETQLTDPDSFISQYAINGDDWLEQQNLGNGAPASDRIVAFNHNQVEEAVGAITPVIEALEADNGSPDQPGLRERILGQLRAGVELIRVGEFKAYLVYLTVVRGLGELIQKYGNPAIAKLADALLGAIVSQIFQAK